MASVQTTAGRRGDALARVLLDPLRAGMQVSGVSFMVVAAIFSIAPRSGDTGGFTWVGLSFLALIVVAIVGYPGPRPRFLAFVGRAFGAFLWGSLIGVAVLSRTRSIDGDEATTRIVVASIGVALFVLGTWPRRRVVAIASAKSESDLVRDVAIAGLVVSAALFAMFPIGAKADWYMAALRGSKRAPDGVALVLGASFGFAIVVTIASSVWMLRRRAAHPWVLTLLPPSLLVAIGLAVDRGLMRPVLAASTVTTSPLDERVAALAGAIGLAWPVWVTTLFSVALLTAVAALVIGLRARVRAPDVSSAGARPIVTLIAGLIATLVIAFASAWLSKGIGSTAIVSSWMALVPAAIGVVALYLAARGGAAFAPDALTSAVFAMLSVIAIAIAQSVRLLSFIDGTMTVDGQARAGTYIASDARGLVLATLPALVPIVVALGCAIRPRDLRAATVRAFPFAGAATLTLGLGFASLIVAARAPVAMIGTLWPRENPSGFTLASGNGDTCDGLLTSDILFVGPTAIERGGKALAPIASLDTDASCAALVVDLERGPKPTGELRIAVDSQIAYARVECLVRALGTAVLRDERSPRPIRRRPRCAFQAVVASRGDHGEPDFPVCTTLRIAGDECNAPKDTEVMTLTPTAILRRRDQRVESLPRGTAESGDFRYDTAPFLLAVDGVVRFADAVNLAQRFGANRSFDRMTARETWLVPTDRPSPAMMATLAPPRFDVTENATVSIAVSGAGDAVEPARRVVGAARDRFVACQAFAAGKGVRSGGSRIALTIAPDGSVTNVWTEGRSGSPVVADCVSRVMSELRFDASTDASAIYVDVVARVLRANVIVSDADDGRGSATRERETENALRGAADGPLRECYETGLRATAGRLTGVIRARLQVNRLGKVTFAFAGRPFDEKVVNCSLDVLRATTMPPNPPGDYEVHATITMTPPSR